MTYIGTAHGDSASATSQLVAVPTGTADSDIMFAVIKRTTTTDPSTPASGWSPAGWPKKTSSSGGTGFWCYYRIASSEPADYTWTWAGAARVSITIYTYRGGFSTGTPIDVVSNTLYETSNTTVRAAGMTVAAANSPLLFLGVFHSSSSVTFNTNPTTPTSDWVEDVEYYNSGGRTARCSLSMTWTGSGATSDMDDTASATGVEKHAFAVALVPSGGAATSLVFEPMPMRHLLAR